MSSEKPNFSFTSPETGEKYTSKYPIHPEAKKNTLFVERLEILNDINRFSSIPHMLLEAGPEELKQFERALGTQNRKLEDLLMLQNSPAMLQEEAEQYVAQFFQTENWDRRKMLAEWISNLLR